MSRVAALPVPPWRATVEAALARRGVVAGLKAVIVALALFPLATIAWAMLFDPAMLGANPAETIIRTTGDRTLQFLLYSLAITPLRRITGIGGLIKFRRMLGLFAFFYGVVHLSSYVGFDRFFVLDEIVKDVVKRPFITVGFAALVLMTPLAVTSTKGWIKRLGGPAWNRLHKLVYAVAILGVVHYWWLVKRDLTWPAIYGAVLAVLLAWRFMKARTVRTRTVRN